MRSLSPKRMISLLVLFLMTALLPPFSQAIWSNNVGNVSRDLSSSHAASVSSVPNQSLEISIAQQSIGNPETLGQQGRQRYEAGQFAEAAQLWQQAAQAYQNQGETLNQAKVLSNLSLAYQQLGQWEEAKQAIASSLELIQRVSGQRSAVSGQREEGKADSRELIAERFSKSESSVLAQALNTQGKLQFSLGQAEAALETWQAATTAYTQAEDDSGVVRSLLNQVQAMRSLGFYRRALKTLEALSEKLQIQPDSLIKANGLRSLGDVLQATGQFERASEALQLSLEIAKRSSSTSENLSAISLSLGNLARAQGNPEAALEFYARAATTATANLTRTQILLNQLSLTIEKRDFATAQTLLPQIQSRLSELPASRDAIYAHINFAQSLMRLLPTPHAQLASQTLTTAVQQAQTLGDRRATSYALGMLGELYEQTQQIQSAQALTQQALAIAQSLNADDVSYRWHWQLGRLLQQQGNLQGAIAAYTNAVNLLQELRGDLVAIDAGVQFSFRESVEPVYRQLVSLLLQDPNSPSVQPETKQKNLKQALDVIESLQLAELVNFFRADCLTANPVEVATVDRNAAVIYPIILSDRLEVIARLPNQPLQHFSTPISQKQVEATVLNLSADLRDPSSLDFLPAAQQIYNWIIRPIADDLTKSGAKTLVFIPDGSLRNIPMSALHDGQHFLVENHSISLAPGLQLIDPKPLARQKIQALIAGLSEARQGFSSLPNVEVELKAIQKEVPSKELLNQALTIPNLEQAIKVSSFPVVHFATHGQFSSEAERTFLLTWDGRVNIEQLNHLLQNRNLQTPNAIELLILSACQTAAGDNRAALGLAGVAVRAGARSTIASLWSVDDRATAALMTQLYQKLATTSTTKAETLRQAQLSLIQDRQYRHPFFWSPFVLLGNWL